jgi:hypothetical protein
VLVPPQLNKPFQLYVAVDTQTIGSALIQEFEGKERIVAYLSRKLLDPETRYSTAEKLCLCVYYSCTKFRHYLLNAECVVYSKFYVIKHMLSMPILNGRIGKWILPLSEFENRQKLLKVRLLLISLLSIMIHRLICLRLLLGLCSLMCRDFIDFTQR